MGYRDDLSAALARVASLEGAAERARDEGADARVRLEVDLASARAEIVRLKARREFGVPAFNAWMVRGAWAATLLAVGATAAAGARSERDGLHIAFSAAGGGGAALAATAFRRRSGGAVVAGVAFGAIAGVVLFVGFLTSVWPRL